MKTLFQKKIFVPKWFIIDASEKILGRLATKISKLLLGKETSFFTPSINQGNFVIVINALKIKITGKKEQQKLYYKTSQRPGTLKTETFKNLKTRIPSKIVESAVYGMLPKGRFGHQCYKRLYVYEKSKILYSNKENLNLLLSKNCNVKVV
jgi:large subunit ribosomal protein L13